MKTSELQGAALDWAVHSIISPDEPIKKGNTAPPYSSDWGFCGPIIEQEKISIEWTGEDWMAYIFHDEECFGPTPLIAAMQCYVASKLGDEIEVPGELQGERA